MSRFSILTVLTFTQPRIKWLIHDWCLFNFIPLAHWYAVMYFPFQPSSLFLIPTLITDIGILTRQRLFTEH